MILRCSAPTIQPPTAPPSETIFTSRILPMRTSRRCGVCLLESQRRLQSWHRSRLLGEASARRHRRRDRREPDGPKWASARGRPAVLVADASLSSRELGFAPALSDLKTIVQTAWAWHRRAHPKRGEQRTARAATLSARRRNSIASRHELKPSRSTASKANGCGLLAIAAWSARPCCGAWRKIDCTLLTVRAQELDLTRQAEVEAWMRRGKAAGRVSGGG